MTATGSHVYSLQDYLSSTRRSMRAPRPPGGSPAPDRHDQDDQPVHTWSPCHARTYTPTQHRRDVADVWQHASTGRVRPQRQRRGRLQLTVELCAGAKTPYPRCGVGVHASGECKQARPGLIAIPGLRGVIGAGVTLLIPHLIVLCLRRCLGSCPGPSPGWGHSLHLSTAC